MMKRRIAIFFVLLANIIILAHAAIPHHHYPFLITETSQSIVPEHKHDHNHTAHGLNHQHHDDKDDYDHCLLNKVVTILKDNAKSLDYSATYWGHSFDGFNAILTNVEFHCKNITVTILQSHLFSSSYTSYAASVLGLRAPPIA